MGSAPTILLGFYRGRSVVSRLIKWQTRSEYSHVAGSLAPADSLGLFPAIEAWHEPYPGGVLKRANWFDGHSPRTRVDVFAVAGISPDLAAQIWRAAEDTARMPGNRYAYRDLLRFLSRRPVMGWDQRWFCSELWAGLLALYGVPLLARVPAAHTTPAMLSWSPRLVYCHSCEMDPAGDLAVWTDAALECSTPWSGRQSGGVAPESPTGEGRPPRTPRSESSASTPDNSCRRGQGLYLEWTKPGASPAHGE